MSEFFEPPPPASAPERYRMPPWVGAPSGTLPAGVSLDRVLARTDTVAVCVSRVSAYPAGFEFDIVTMSGDARPFDPLLFGAQRHLHGDSQEAGIPPAMLRIGVQFADGSKATNVGGFHHDRTPPPGPVLHPGGGGGGGGSWRQTFWVWPLPPAGPLELVCEWPAAGIPVTRQEIDAEPIIEAAQRAQVVFSDEHLPPWPPEDGSTWSPMPAQPTERPETPADP